MNEELITPTESLAVIEGIERASIDMQIETAHRHPRILSKVKQDMLSFATLDEETAASCFYTLPRGGKTIQGPSVRLAEIAISSYGNIRAGSRIISVVTTGENPHVVVQSVAHDLERNTAVSIEKRRNISAKKDRNTGERLPISADDVNLAANACSAIAFRDAVYKVVPLALIKPVMEAAKRVAIGDASSLSVKRSKIIDRLKQMGVLEERILQAVEARKIEDIGTDKLEVLIGLGTSIKDGELTVEQAFPAPVQPKEFVAPTPEKTPEPKRGRPRKKAVQEDPPKEEDEIPMEWEEKPKEPEIPVQEKLGNRLVAEGYSFDNLKVWNRDIGFLDTDLEMLGGFGDLNTHDATRLWNSITGLLNGLKGKKSK